MPAPPHACPSPPCLAGRWPLFFSLQGPLLVAEAWLGRLLRQAAPRLRLPRLLRTALVLGLLHALAHRLFFSELIESGVPARLLVQLWPGVCGAQ